MDETPGLVQTALCSQDFALWPSNKKLESQPMRTAWKSTQSAEKKGTSVGNVIINYPKSCALFHMTVSVHLQTRLEIAAIEAT